MSAYTNSNLPRLIDSWRFPSGIQCSHYQSLTRPHATSRMPCHYTVICTKYSHPSFLAEKPVLGSKSMVQLEGCRESRRREHSAAGENRVKGEMFGEE